LAKIQEPGSGAFIPEILPLVSQRMAKPTHTPPELGEKPEIAIALR
jgi:hypothetical protein